MLLNWNKHNLKKHLDVLQIIYCKLFAVAAVIM